MGLWRGHFCPPRRDSSRRLLVSSRDPAKSTNSGHFRKRRLGQRLLEVETGRTGVAPPIKYAIDGKQYVASMGGPGRAVAVVALIF
jgi:hypothetical protein